jgi:hypothetical protein
MHCHRFWDQDKNNAHDSEAFVIYLDCELETTRRIVRCFDRIVARNEPWCPDEFVPCRIEREELIGTALLIQNVSGGSSSSKSPYICGTYICSVGRYRYDFPNICTIILLLDGTTWGFLAREAMNPGRPNLFGKPVSSLVTSRRDVTENDLVGKN